MKNPVLKKFFTLFLLPSCIFAIGCGGGSAGTGTTSFQGKILTPDNEPVEGATVTVVGSGETAVSDDQGRFSLNTQSPATGGVALQVQAPAENAESPAVNATVNVPVTAPDNVKVGVKLEVDPKASTVTVKNIEVSTDILGACKGAFAQNGASFVQVKPIVDGTGCIAKVSARERGAALGGVGAQVQRRRCESDAPWRSIASGTTAFTGEPGSVQLSFKFFTDEEHCRYRIVAPVNDPERPSLVFDISTLRQKEAN